MLEIKEDDIMDFLALVLLVVIAWNVSNAVDLFKEQLAETQESNKLLRKLLEQDGILITEEDSEEK